jgi:hypothetical protein
MKRHEFLTFLDWWSVNEAEYSALSDAQDGSPVPLANLIRSVGRLETLEAREFVADRLEGKKQQRGRKRTIEQQAKELGVLSLVRGIQKELECSEYRALEVFLERYPDVFKDKGNGGQNEALRTCIRRAKEFLKEAFGREPPPLGQKRRNSDRR